MKKLHQNVILLTLLVIYLIQLVEYYSTTLSLLKCARESSGIFASPIIVIIEQFHRYTFLGFIISVIIMIASLKQNGGKLNILKDFAVVILILFLALKIYFLSKLVDGKIKQELNKIKLNYRPINK
jgi:heme A synthase